MKLVRRISEPPQSRGGSRCPDIWETVEGNIVVIGIDITDQIQGDLPPTADISPGEKAVMIPRSVFLSAKDNG